MKTYNEMLGENRKKMAEQAIQRGSEANARTNFKLASEAFRAAANENPGEKARLLALADEMETLSAGDLTYLMPKKMETNCNNISSKTTVTANKDNDQKS